MIKKKSPISALKVALLISLVINIGVLVWFYNNEDLRKEKLTVVIEKKEGTNDELKKKKDEDEEDEEEKEKDKPDVSEKDIEEVKEFVEKEKKKELQEDIQEMEDLKEEMEDLLNKQLEELPEQVEKDLYEQLAQELIQDTKQLRKDVRQERKAVNFKKDRHKRVDEGLKDMENMDPIEQAQDFILNAEIAAAELGDTSPNITENKKGEKQEEQLGEKDQETLKELSERAADLAARARDLAGMEILDMLQPGQTLEEIQPQDMQAMNPAEMYEYAQNLEENLNRDFAAHQALDLASVAGSDLQQALEAVPQNFPQRPDLSAELNPGEMNSTSHLELYHAALEQAAGETGRMRMSSMSRVRNAAGRTGQENGRQLVQARRAMAQAANQQGSRGFADYSQVMRQMNGMINMGNQNGGSHGVANATAEFGNIEGMGIGGKRGGPNLNQNQIKRQALPGRRFSSNAQRQGWLFLDTWYLIGPWDKKAKMFEPPLPPEIDIDLDAEYVGKEMGRGKNKEPMTLRWRFSQSNTVRITPYDHTGDSVYFGYTEVYADEPMEALVAVASDDGAKLWINDIIVHEDTGLSSWRMDEGFRKISLKQGFNKVLIRVENGPNVCYWSVLLCPADLMAKKG